MYVDGIHTALDRPQSIHNEFPQQFTRARTLLYMRARMRAQASERSREFWDARAKKECDRRGEMLCARRGCSAKPMAIIVLAAHARVRLDFFLPQPRAEWYAYIGMRDDSLVCE